MALRDAVERRRHYLALSTEPVIPGGKIRYIAGDEFSLVKAEVEKDAKAFGLSFEIYAHLTSAVTTVHETTVTWGDHHGN